MDPFFDDFLFLFPRALPFFMLHYPSPLPPKTVAAAALSILYAYMESLPRCPSPVFLFFKNTIIILMLSLLISSLHFTSHKKQVVYLRHLTHNYPPKHHNNSMTLPIQIYKKKKTLVPS